MTLLHPIRRHPLLGYFALTYGISWGGIFVVLGASGFDLPVLRTQSLDLATSLIFICMLLGPSLAGLTMTALLGGQLSRRPFPSAVA